MYPWQFILLMNHVNQEHQIIDNCILFYLKITLNKPFYKQNLEQNKNPQMFLSSTDS